MKLSEQQKSLIRDYAKSYYNCRFGHPFCDNPKHYVTKDVLKSHVTGSPIKAIPLSHSKLFLEFRDDPVTGMPMLVTPSQRHIDNLKRLWAESARYETVTNNNQEDKQRHTNYNERLYNHAYDNYIAKQPVYHKLHFILDRLNQQFWASITIFTTQDEMVIDITKIINSLNQHDRRQFIRKETLSQSNQDKVDKLINQACQDYLSYRANTHKL